MLEKQLAHSLRKILEAPRAADATGRHEDENTSSTLNSLHLPCTTKLAEMQSYITEVKAAAVENMEEVVQKINEMDATGRTPA